MGKAQKTYTALSVEDSADYDLVKLAILKNYELFPEVYHQRSRDYRKIEAPTYIKFLR